MSGNRPGILVADSNKNVACFLAREFCRLGFRTLTAVNEAEMWAVLKRTAEIDLMVFDPDLTSRKPLSVLAGARGLHPGLKVVIHDFDPTWAERVGLGEGNAFVEKKGDNLNSLVYSVKWMLGRDAEHEAGQTRDKRCSCASSAGQAG